MAEVIPTTESPHAATRDVVEAPYTSDRSSVDDMHEKPVVDNGPPKEELTATESDYEYPPPAQATVVMLTIILAIFPIALDRTVIATAVPQITNEFHSLDDIGWYGSSFLLTACTFQLLLGRVYTYYTPKHVFLATIVLFEIGSIICGAAPNSTAFILGRAIAGIGSGGIMSGAIVLMTMNLPLAKRPKWQGFLGAVFGLSSISGPLLGGAFTTNVTWRWCFYINLPIGAVVMLVSMFVLKPQAASKPEVSFRQQLLNLDPLGNLFLFPSITCMLLALQWGGTTYAWSDGRIIALWVVFAVTFIAFVVVQIRMPETATVPPSIVKNRSVLAGIGLTFCLGASLMILVYYIPIWFQAIKGVSAVQSGINILPLMLAFVIATIFAGVLTGRTGYYTPYAYASAIVMPIGAGLISTWVVDTGSNKWIGYQVVYGFGAGLGMQQSNLAAQTVLKREDVATGISLMFLSQMLSGAIFISVGQNVLGQKLVSGLTAQIPGLDAQTIVKTGVTELRALVPPEDLPLVLETYSNALRQVFYVAVGMTALTVLAASAFEWKSVKEAQDGKAVVKTTEKSPEVAV